MQKLTADDDSEYNVDKPLQNQIHVCTVDEIRKKRTETYSKTDDDMVVN